MLRHLREYRTFAQQKKGKFRGNKKPINRSLNKLANRT